MKRGQMKLSFGMIFSIILIITFLGFAFWAILQFLGTQEAASIGIFADNVQDAVTTMYRSSVGRDQVERTFRLSSDDIEQVCFADFACGRNDCSTGGNAQRIIYRDISLAYSGNENFFFYPEVAGKNLDQEIAYVDLARITAVENPYCFPVEDGQVSMLISKDVSNGPLVVVERG